MASSRRKFPPPPSNLFFPCQGAKANRRRWTYIKDDAPNNYRTGHTINLVGQIIVFFLAIFGILYCRWENRMRAAGKRDHRLEGLTEEQQEKLGYRHPRFYYWS